MNTNRTHDIKTQMAKGDANQSIMQMTEIDRPRGVRSTSGCFSAHRQPCAGSRTRAPIDHLSCRLRIVVAPVGAGAFAASYRYLRRRMKIARICIPSFSQDKVHHCADQPNDRGFVGEDPDDVGAAFDFLVEPLQRVGNRYENRGAHSFGWDRLVPGVWCGHPGRGAPGAR
jgi:hypothetical protein